MQARVWTVHRRLEQTRFVGDGFAIWALIVPPVWALWHGMWLTLVAMIVLMALATAYNPLAGSPVMYGIGLILALDGSEIRRLELHLRGWREAAAVEARTIEGAEELWIEGRAV